MIDFRNIFSVDYLIRIDPSMLHRTDYALLLIGGILSGAGIIFALAGRFAPHQYGRQLWYRLSRWAFTIGLLEVLWFGLRYERAVYLGSHLAAFIILLIGVIWLVPILKYCFGQYRRDVDQWQKDQVKQKYLYRK